MRVVKNTLARKALVGTSFEAIGPKLKGPLVLAFSKDDPGAAARVVKDFAKANEKFVPTLVSLGGQVLSAKDLDKVASLPTKEQAIAQLMGLLRAPDSEAGPHPRRAAGEARPHHCRRSRPETGRRRLNCLLKPYLGVPTWLPTKTKSSTQFPR